MEWLGNVPEHWEVVRLDGAYKIVRGNTGFSKADLLEKGQYVALQYGKTYKVDEINNYFTSYVNQEFFKVTQIAEFEDVILISTSETLEDLGHSCFYARQDIGLIGGEQFLLKPNQKDTLGKYLYYSTKVFSRYLHKYATGTKVYRFNIDDLKTIYIPKLSSFDQQKIVSFLDTETARIDTLIAKQEKLIELLEEQRKSIISHAVTKGLNPNAPMKDGGVEWLGEVPEHWMTPSSKHLLEIPITDGPHETPNFVDDGVPFISAEAISKGKIDFDKKRGYITPELNAIYSKKYSPKIEDIYMVKSGATTGKVAMVETTEEFNIWSPLAVFRCNKNKVLPKFLLAVFNSSHFYDALVLNWSYGTQQNIGMGVLSNIEIPCPPLKEQAEIIQHLDAQNTKFDKLISTQSQLIEKLKEYRSSIISHAVTGKIDVREFSA